MIHAFKRIATAGVILFASSGHVFAQQLPSELPLPRSRPSAVPLPTAQQTAPISLTAAPSPATQTMVTTQMVLSDAVPATLPILPRVKPGLKPLQAAGSSSTPTPAKPAITSPAKPAATAALPAIPKTNNGIAAIRGSLKEALDALSKNEQRKALGIHKGMPPSLDRTLLTYLLTIGGYHDLTAAEIKKFYDQHPDWPSNSLVIRRIEEAVAREIPTGPALARAFGSIVPASPTAGIEVAISQAMAGNRDQAARIIRPIWRESALDARTESRILSNLGKLLTREDHFHRASYLLYRDRATGAQRLERYLTDGQKKLVEARIAVIREEKNAGAKLKAVPSSLRNDPGYVFSYIQYLRRSGQETAAADMMVKAPTEKTLINHTAWWDERRLLARMMMNAGDAKRAYKVAATHATDASDEFSEAEFHAGFFALQYLHDPKTAAIHFERSWQKTSSARDKSRGLYWQGRAWEAAGDRTNAVKFYKAAANPTVYYGQLALEEIGQTTLQLRDPPAPSAATKRTFEARDQVRAIKRLKALKHKERAGPIFRHLARQLDNPSEVLLLHELAQSYDLHQNAVQIGQIALSRGMPAEKMAFPLHVLPMGVKTNGVDIALVYALTKQESVFNIGAVSYANARGLMQMLPATAKTTARKLGVGYNPSKLTKDPAYAVLLGSAFLKENLERFNGSYILTFAAYNAGPRRPPSWIERFGDPRTNEVSAIDWVERIPFSETRDYVMKLIENLQIYEARIHGTPLDISKDLKRGHP